MSDNDILQQIHAAVARGETTFHLSGSRLTRLPPEIGVFRNLTLLDLSKNQLTRLPPEIGQLRNLTLLDVSDNQLTRLPPEIGQLRKLDELVMHRNRLTTLPPEIGALENLSLLTLDRKLLTSLPSQLRAKILSSSRCLDDTVLVLFGAGVEALVGFLRRDIVRRLQSADRSCDFELPDLESLNCPAPPSTGYPIGKPEWRDTDYRVVPKVKPPALEDPFPRDTGYPDEPEREPLRLDDLVPRDTGVDLAQAPSSRTTGAYPVAPCPVQTVPSRARKRTIGRVIGLSGVLIFGALALVGWIIFMSLWDPREGGEKATKIEASLRIAPKKGLSKAHVSKDTGADRRESDSETSTD